MLGHVLLLLIEHGAKDLANAKENERVRYCIFNNVAEPVDLAFYNPVLDVTCGWWRCGPNDSWFAFMKDGGITFEVFEAEKRHYELYLQDQDEWNVPLYPAYWYAVGRNSQQDWPVERRARGLPTHTIPAISRAEWARIEEECKSEIGTDYSILKFQLRNASSSPSLHISCRGHNGKNDIMHTYRSLTASRIERKTGYEINSVTNTAFPTLARYTIGR